MCKETIYSVKQIFRHHSFFSLTAVDGVVEMHF